MMKKGIVYLGLFLLFYLTCRGQTVPDDFVKPEITVESVETVSRNEGLFHGWPTVIITDAGDLLAVYSGGREGHVCPFGRVEMIYSKDNGKTWSEPQILVDTPLDDRDAGILETDRGTLLVTWFTSTAFVSRILKVPGTTDEWPQERLDLWRNSMDNMKSANCPYPEIRKFMERKEQKGIAPLYPVAQWMIRSEDGRRSWSEPYHVPLMSPNGPKLTRDNRLLWAGKDESFIGVTESFDDGRTWEIIGQIPAYPGHDPANYHELDIIECEDGALIAQIRNHNEPYDRETLQTRSDDGGRTWTVPRSINVWGLPSHLIRLPGNTLLMSYGYRREPRTVYVRFSSDCGRNWSDPHSLSETTGDFGYPTTAVLPDGRLLTLWYETLPGNDKAQLVQAIWQYKLKTIQE